MKMIQDLKNRIALALAGHAVMCKHSDLISSKIIYEAEFEAEAEDDGYGYDLISIEDKNSNLKIDNYFRLGKKQFLSIGKKYKVTLKIEEVE